MKKVFSLLFLVFPIVSIYSQEKETELQYPFDETGTEAPRGVFGSDDRKEVKDAHGIADFVRATAVMIPKSNIRGNRVYGQTLRQKLTRKFGASKFDKNLRFLDQPTVAYCTGFLIAPDILVTAGHCIERISDAEKYVWVFDYTSEINFNEYNGYVQIDPNNVYEVKEVLNAYFRNLSTYTDYSVLKLNRKTSRKPYRFRTSGEVTSMGKVSTIGSPTGLPLKYADNAFVIDNSPKKWFKNNIDGFPGNSGGPVFNPNGFIEGIHVRGAVELHDGAYTGDYKYDENCSCIKTLQWASTYGTAGSHAHRITSIPYELHHRAIYENIEYAIENNLTNRLKSWLAYSWMVDHDYTKRRGRLEILAAKRNNLRALKTIISKSKNENIDIYGETLINYAISNNSVDMLEYLLTLDIPYDTNSSAMLNAFKNGSYKMVYAMLDNGWNVNATDYRGNNLLHLAATKNNMTLLRDIVAKGVSATAKNKDGKRPEHIAKKHKNKIAQKYLKKVRKQQS